MKRFISLIGVIAILLTMSVSVFAGSVPEDLLQEDTAKVFLGTVKNYTTKDIPSAPYTEIDSVEVIPTEKIKGDVEIGIKQTYSKCHSSLELKPNVEYLFGYFDENNFYIYEIESREDKQFKLVDSDKHDMTKRLEDYLNVGVFARAEQERSSIGNQISFAEFLYKKPSLSSSLVEKVTFHYQNELYEVDKDKFFQIAEDIMITNVKNGQLHDMVAKPKQPDPYETSLFISLIDANDKTAYFGAVSRLGEVDRYNLSMGRLMQKDYEMKTEDLSKLYSLLPADVQKGIVVPESLPISTETLPLKLPDVPIKDYTGWIVGGVAVIFVVAFAIGFGIRNKKQK